MTRQLRSLDTPPTAPHHDPSFPSFTSLSQIPPLSQTPQPDISSPVVGLPAAQAPSPAVAYAEARRFSRGSHASTSSQDKWARAHSPSSGCQISAPISPPVGYPLSFYSGGRRNSSSSGLAPLPRPQQAPPPHPPAEALVAIFLHLPRRRGGLSHRLLPTRTLVGHFPSALVKVAQIST